MYGTTEQDELSVSHLGILTDGSPPELTDDGRAIRNQLERDGIEAKPVAWTDQSINWNQYDAVLFRSCWEYHTDPDRFRTLLDELSAADVTVVNPPAAVDWNMHKSYLHEFAATDVQLPPTVVIEAGSSSSLESVLHREGWEHAVVKPAIGASSTGVWRTSVAEAATHSERFRRANETRDLVIQQFVPEIEAGERSIVFLRGQYSHAWNDLPTDDDFSAFDETDLTYDPLTSICTQAKTVMETACQRIGFRPSQLLYARVDYVERGGELLLFEVELIEPYRGLSRTNHGVDRFVSALTDLLGGKSASTA